eukprot:1027811-Rhodomonas_salina.1
MSASVSLHTCISAWHGQARNPRARISAVPVLLPATPCPVLTQSVPWYQVRSPTVVPLRLSWTRSMLQLAGRTFCTRRPAAGTTAPVSAMPVVRDAQY